MLKDLTAIVMVCRTKKLGKVEARRQFGLLLKSLAEEGGVVEVTDHGKTAAVIINYQDYLDLLSKARAPQEQFRQHPGSASLAEDLELASREIADSILQAVEKSGAGI